MISNQHLLKRKKMKELVISIIIAITLISCHSKDYNYTFTDNDRIALLECYSINFKPTSIDFEKSVQDNKILYFIITNISYDRTYINRVYRCINILFLKQCLYAMQKTPLTIDLYTYNDPKLQKLFIIYNNIQGYSKTSHGLYSSEAHYNAKKDSILWKDCIISNLIYTIENTNR